MSAIISQREARRLRRRVQALEDLLCRQRRFNEWRGVEVARVVEHSTADCVRVAQKLGHYVVAIANTDGSLRLVALPHPEERP